MTAPKKTRLQLAKSELLLQLSATAQRWSDDCVDKGTARPFAEWENEGAVDPFHQLCRTYGLTPQDLSNVLNDIAAETETRAVRAGYDNIWDPDDDLSAPDRLGRARRQ